MSIAEFQFQGQMVLALAFFLSIVLGIFLHRSHFCTMGAISDVVYSGNWLRANQWLLAIAFACLGVGLLHATQLIEPERASSISTRLNWLSDCIGGLMFGVGMVLSSGCGAKMLVRLGTGNLKSLLVLLVMGISSFATLKGLTAVIRVSTVDQFFWDASFDLTLHNWLFHIAGIQMPFEWVATIFAAALMLGVLSNSQGRKTPAWIIGIGMGALVCLAWLLSGYLGHVAEHPETLEDVFIKTNTNRMEAFTFVAPVAYVLDWLIYYSDSNKSLTIGILSVFGVSLGAHLSARWSGSFKWESFANASDFKTHLVGAVLMGVGGVTAMGCTFGQGLSGLSVLSLNAMIAVPFMVIGALLALIYQQWAIERNA